ncbi:MAG: hypothetical protein R3E50_11120 [Halioglobus sp.]
MTARQPGISTVEKPGPVGGARVFETYQLFDTVIRSQLPLPEARCCRGREAAVTVTVETDGLFEPRQFVPCHEWRREGGPLICATARRGRGVPALVSRPRQLSPQAGRPYWLYFGPGAGEQVVRQLPQGQVIPRYLAHTGELLLHASAVILPNGRTVAFLGESGQGKSTLAYYCYRNGAHIIDDDCVLATDAGISVAGGAPAIGPHPAPCAHWARTRVVLPLC